MVAHRRLGSTQADVPASDFFDKYISKRLPVVVRGLPDDVGFRARSWADLDYLERKAGDAEVLVEPMHPTSHQFGTDVERVQMPFRDFLDSLKQSEGPYHYLTTQYADQDSDEQTVLPPPADALVDDYPRVPRLMGNLGLQQVNLWIGRSQDGSTSGLHHDFHDNLYCLLRGRKRFVLYPPSEVKNLCPHGTLDTHYENGLISYADVPVRADGLPIRLALKTRVKAIEKKLDAMPKSKGKGKSRGNIETSERKALMKAHDDALDELAQYTLEAEDGIDVDDEVDDFDALMATMDGGDEDLLDEGPSTASDPADEVDGDDSDEEEEEEWAGIDPVDEDAADKEPPSFSRIPTALVHQHLGLPTTARLPPDVSADDFPSLRDTGAPFVVELNAGEMLYLPASWWHEVTSSSGESDDEAIHMAFNYWFYPPTRLDRFEEPYEDTLVWEYFRSQAQKPEIAPTPIGGKRKGEAVDAQGSKKMKK